MRPRRPTRVWAGWLFDRWSDAGARLHNLTIPAAASALTAFYREDKAANRPADASSSGAGLGPELANDVSSATRWSSSYADNEWWQVDLGTARKVDTVEINWENAYASQYKIQVSTDRVNFTDVATVNLPSSRLERTTFPVQTARYVRVLGVTRATRWGFSFFDARVLGPDDAAPPPQEDKARGKPAAASSVYKTFAAALANDADSTTRWSSVFADGEWWRVDLGATRQVDTVELNWEAAYPSTYKVQVSTDGTTFTDAATVSISNPGWKKTTFPARDARYVRVLSVNRATGFGISLWDARVFGPDDAAPPPPPPPPVSQEKATGATATASSVEKVGFEAGKAVDARLHHTLVIGPSRQPVVAGRPRPLAQGGRGRAQLGGGLRAPVPHPDLRRRRHVHRCRHGEHLVLRLETDGLRGAGRALRKGPRRGARHGVRHLVLGRPGLRPQRLTLSGAGVGAR